MSVRSGLRRWRRRQQRTRRRRRVCSPGGRTHANPRLPLEYRDYCAHILIPLNECRRQTWFSPWKCTDLRHSYEKCQFDEYQRRVTIAQLEKQNGSAEE